MRGGTSQGIVERKESKLLAMLIGQRLRDIRVAKNLRQDAIEQVTGLARRYISRVENGHTVPSVGTLQKCAGALGVQLYQVLYNGEGASRTFEASKQG